MMVALAGAVLVGVFVATFAAQRVLTDRIQEKIARKLAAPRQLHAAPRGLQRLTVADGLHLTLGQVLGRPHPAQLTETQRALQNTNHVWERSQASARSVADA